MKMPKYASRYIAIFLMLMVIIFIFNFTELRYIGVNNGIFLIGKVSTHGSLGYVTSPNTKYEVISYTDYTRVDNKFLQKVHLTEADIGKKVRIYFDGGILESAPARIKGVKRIILLKE